MSMTWQDITVGQYMDLYKLSTEDMEVLEKEIQAVCIIYNITHRQCEELPYAKYKQLASEAGKFLREPIPNTKRKKVIRAGKHKFFVNYDPSKLRQRQYVEILHFGKDPIANMNLVLASLVQPIRLGVKRKNTAEEHEQIAEQLLEAKVTDVFPACVFFCNLYKNLMKAGRDYLVSEIMKTNQMTKKEAEDLITASIHSMDGFTTLRG